MSALEFKVRRILVSTLIWLLALWTNAANVHAQEVVPPTDLGNGLYLVVEQNEHDAADVTTVADESAEGQALTVLRTPVLPISGLRSVKVRERRSGEVVVLVRLAGVDRDSVHSATSAHVRRRLALIVHGLALTAPLVYEPIRSTTLQISGGDTLDEANAFVERARTIAGLPR